MSHQANDTLRREVEKFGYHLGSVIELIHMGQYFVLCTTVCNVVW